VAQPRQAHRGIEGVGAQLGGRRGLVCAEHGPPRRETPRGRLRITSSVRSIAAVAGRDPPTLSTVLQRPGDPFAAAQR
jgi:hypothetical protein